MERSEVHVLDEWCYLGTARTDAELAELLGNPRPRVFSLENYKLLSRLLKSPPPRCRIIPLVRAQAIAA
jgi:DNA polymerase-3 subunit epsilon